MSPTIFYREQAARQKEAADSATLENVRERCQRAADAWVELADRSERTEAARRQVTAGKLAATPDELLVISPEPSDLGAAHG